MISLIDWTSPLFGFKNLQTAHYHCSEKSSKRALRLSEHITTVLVSPINNNKTERATKKKEPKRGWRHPGVSRIPYRATCTYINSRGPQTALFKHALMRTPCISLRLTMNASACVCVFVCVLLLRCQVFELSAVSLSGPRPFISTQHRLVWPTVNFK